MIRRGNRDDAKTTTRNARSTKRRAHKPTPRELLTQLSRETKTLALRVETLEAAQREMDARAAAAEKAQQDYVKRLHAGRVSRQVFLARELTASAMSAVTTTQSGYDAYRRNADATAKQAQELVDEMGRIVRDRSRGPSVAFHIAEDAAQAAERNPFWRAVSWLLDAADSKIGTRVMYGCVVVFVLSAAVWLAAKWQLI